MHREFIVNILFLLFINVLIKPAFIFGIELQVQNRTGAEYGLYFALLNLTYIFQILNDFGIQSFNNRHISQHPQLLPKYFPNLLAIKLLLGGLYVLLSLVLAWLMRYEGWALGLLLLLLANQVLVQVIFFLRSNLSGLGHYRTDSVLSALDKLLMLLTCGLLLWYWPTGQPLRLEAFAMAQTLPLLLTAGIAFGILRGKVRFPVRPSWADNWRAGLPTLLVLFRQSLPYALAIFLMYAYTRSDGVLLERFCGKGHAEVYAGAFRVLDACNMLGYLFASLLLPMFARMEKRGDSARPLVGLSFRLIWAASITLAAAICFARRELLEIMMPAQASAYRWDTLGVLIWAFVPFSATNIFSTLLTAQGHLRAALRYFALGIALNFGLNALLMPQAQALGAAFAAVLTQGFVAVAMIWLSLRRFGWRPRPATLGQFAGFAVFILVADFLLFEYSALGWPLNMAIALALGPLGLLIFRWVKFSQLASLKK